MLFVISVIVLFISVYLFFNSSRFFLDISCIFSIFASILFPRSSIIFTVIILNCFSGRFPISTSFSYFSGVLSCSFIWYIALCLFILSFFLWMWFLFHRLQDCSSSCFCSLPSGRWGCLRGLCKFPDGRDWWWVELIKTLICLTADGWGWLPSLLLVWPEVTQHWSLQAIWWG